MARPDYPLAAAIGTVRRGQSARSGLAAYRAGGGVVRDATWYRTVAEVRASLAGRLTEATQPLGQRPAARGIFPMITRDKSGYIQQAEVFVRFKSTGSVTAKPYSYKATTLATRQAVLDQAIEHFNMGIADSPIFGDEVVVGAAYTGTYQLIPQEE